MQNEEPRIGDFVGEGDGPLKDNEFIECEGQERRE